ncbi:hybrid sensor histidine kinase/response regulator [Polaribacter reichenbachii]|uniref:histidine kinase n=1 Tax=Polaribacter reichenbachii TaxID=996801 RepID=A0A1B8TUT1_9FLAO|nr:hybrid sensor histidine kinase/response regulator transcription factor [Polaribacter reichenbachii]APZ45576.1 hybrid sensor histidine kinase/response regulator [Polaribacter reichenbachii]AUC19438.1 hybrid sensor histidine kinase/response regulator [Polaribacter reichenbachii]OBY63407.1 hybrid sensor histidine kinase/response regulator [Polaribacter reichenbachii]
MSVFFKKNYFVISFILCLTITLFNAHLYAQKDIYFEHITTKNGLSQNDVNAIYQDNQGFMWFGTHDGLNKFDGYNFTVYNYNQQDKKSINSNLIFTIEGDDKGNLWVGTSGSGLNFFNRATEDFKPFTHNEKDPKSIISNTITNTLKDSKNRLWIGTSDGLDMININDPINKIKFNHIKIKGFPFKNKNVYVISSIFEDSNQTIWIGTGFGLFKLVEDKTNNTLYLEKQDVNIKYINSIKEHNNKLIIGSGNGLYTLNLDSEKDLQVIRKANYTHSLSEIIVFDNKIWGGTANGLIEFDILKKNDDPIFKKAITYDADKKNGISKNIITSLFKDNTNILWVGTNGGGINKYDAQRKPFIHIKNTTNPKSLSYDKVRSVFEDSNGFLWIGTEGGSLNMLSKEDKQNKNYNFIKYPKIKNTFAIEEIKKGNQKILLVGSSSSSKLSQFDITNPNNIKEIHFKEFKKNSARTFSILSDSHNNIWIGSYNNGITRILFDKKTKTYKNDFIKFDIKDSLSISSDIIRNILEDKNGNIWFATGDGLCFLSKKEITKEKPSFKVYKNNPNDSTSISYNYILELFESKKGDLWIGTFGGGLSKFIPATNNSKAQFKTYRKQDGLPNNVVKGILEDNQNNLWISTNKGLSRFNPEKETFMNYDVNDGLQDDEFQELARTKLKNGNLVFGGVNGFNIFNPNDVTNNSFEPETIVTNFSISNKPVKIGENINGRVLLKNSISNKSELNLLHYENNLYFEFAALHFAAPEKNEFAYMLKGFDKDWIYTNSKKRNATYTNLTSGNYTLLVKASNNDKLWDSTPFELNIKIEPPFWLTKLAFFFYFLLMVCFLLLFRRFTIIKTSKKHSLELEHVAKEKNEELQRIKLEFFTNITHEFTTPLTLIQGPLNYLQKKGDTLEKSVVSEQYKLMKKNTDYLLRLISQLLDFRKLSQGKMRLVMRKSNIYQFIKEVSEPFQFLAQKNIINFTVDTADKNLQTWFDHETLEKVINNLLSNAFKFTPDHGAISIHISRENETDMIFTNPTKVSKFVYIQVKDTGKGMDESKVENIFDRFFSEKNKEKKDARGMGIGLAFVKDIVELHQGEIRVISKRNEGTNFIVRLPIEKKAYLNVPEITIKEITESDFYMRSSESDSLAISINDEIVDEKLNEASKSDLPTLLIVDDNEDIRSFIKIALKNTYKIYTAENGQEGLDLALEIIPKVIISDIMMPVMDGIEFCNQIKSRKETSHIPIVLLTAKLSKENEIEGLKTGADAYIRKPFDVEILELKLSNILKFREELRSKFNLEITLQPKEVTVTSMDERFLQQAMEVVEKHMTNTDFNVEMLIKEMGYSRTNLYTKFKEITGLSSSEFIRSIRLKRAVQLFEQSDLSVKEIMYMTGFNTASYFAKCFKKQFGVIPSQYVKQKNKK